MYVYARLIHAETADRVLYTTVNSPGMDWKLHGQRYFHRENGGPGTETSYVSRGDRNGCKRMYIVEDH